MQAAAAATFVQMVSEKQTIKPKATKREGRYFMVPQFILVHDAAISALGERQFTLVLHRNSQELFNNIGGKQSLDCAASTNTYRRSHTNFAIAANFVPGGTSRFVHLRSAPLTEYMPIVAEKFAEQSVFSVFGSIGQAPFFGYDWFQVTHEPALRIESTSTHQPAVSGTATQLDANATGCSTSGTNTNMPNRVAVVTLTKDRTICEPLLLLGRELSMPM